VSYLHVIYINYYYMYFIVKTHSALCMLLSNGKFYIHFGGSLEYWINEYEYGYTTTTTTTTTNTTTTTTTTTNYQIISQKYKARSGFKTATVLNFIHGGKYRTTLLNFILQWRDIKDFKHSNKILCRFRSSEIWLCSDWFKISMAT